MSNPAVIKLQSGHVGKSKVWLDDNYGEAIHIHIDDYRVDLSVKEFKQINDDLFLALTNLIDVEGFDASQIDPVFMSVMLWSKLPHLTRVSYDRVMLEDLYAPYHSSIFRLKDSVGYRAIKSGQAIVEKRRKSQLIGQTEAQRMDSIMESLKKNGYPEDNHYIIVYGDDNIIRDGQHRASCLYYLYGNIEIPILRLYFDNYKSPDLSNLFIHNTRCLIRKKLSIIHPHLKGLIKIPFTIGRFIRKRMCMIKMPFTDPGQFETDVERLFSH